MKSTLIVLMFGLIQPVHAANYSIKQILGARNRIVIDNATDLQVGTEMIATFKNGTQCTMKVTAVEGRIANADTTYCENAASLVVGQSLEKSLFVEEGQNRAASKPVKHNSPNTPPLKTQSTWTPRPPPARKLVDLQYFPNQGELVFAPSLHFTQKNETSKLTTSKDTIADVTTEANALRAEMLYGYTQNFTVGVQFSYLVNQSAKVSYGTGSPNNGQKDNLKSDGLFDPEFKLGYRFYEQDTMPVILDLFTSWSPGIGKNKSPTTTAHGTAMRGGNLFSLGAEIGNKSPGFSFVCGLDMDFYSASTAVDASTGVGTRSSPVSVYTLRVGGQMPVSQSLHVRGSLARITSGGRSTSAPSQDLTYDADPQTELSASLVHEYSDQMTFRFALSKRFESDTSGKVGDVQSLSITSDALTAAISAQILF